MSSSIVTAVTKKYTSPDVIRSIFSSAMSEMYKKEVPLYADLLKLVESVNKEVLLASSSNNNNKEESSLSIPILSKEKEEEGTISTSSIDSIQRLTAERHGAIRLGSPYELRTMKRLFAIMGMFPVSYYDLSVANIPVHSTAFRPIDARSLSKNPFRIFTSLLRLDLIRNETLKEKAKELIDSRQIFTDKCLSLLNKAESQKGRLDEHDARDFVTEAIETFRWHNEARVDYDTYRLFHDTTHRIIADIVCFHGPHINHLTPRTLDIDIVQERMLQMMMDNAKDIVEGPPKRTQIPILLRQTSFKALSESVYFQPSPTSKEVEEGPSSSSSSCSDSTISTASGSSDSSSSSSSVSPISKTSKNNNTNKLFPGKHTARFGEIEQRGCALTRKGRKLYDRLLQKVRNNEEEDGSTYASRLDRVFREEFPDTIRYLREQNLAYFYYRVVVVKDNNEGKSSNMLLRKEDYNDYHHQQQGSNNDSNNNNNTIMTKLLDRLIDRGMIVCDPLIYEDFLPISAAGIFKSNLLETRTTINDTTSNNTSFDNDKNSNNKKIFEDALGCNVYDEFELYEKIQNESIQTCFRKLFSSSSSSSTTTTTK